MQLGFAQPQHFAHFDLDLHQIKPCRCCDVFCHSAFTAALVGLQAGQNNPHLTVGTGHRGWEKGRCQLPLECPAEKLYPSHSLSSSSNFPGSLESKSNKPKQPSLVFEPSAIDLSPNQTTFPARTVSHPPPTFLHLAKVHPAFPNHPALGWLLCF